MKQILSKVVFLIVIAYSISLHGLKGVDDPFLEGVDRPLPKLDPETLALASGILSDEVMKRLDEPRLGAAREGRPCRRFFLCLSDNKLFLLKLFMPIEGDERFFVRVKQLENMDEEWVITKDYEVGVSEAQQQLLNSVYLKADPLNLPVEDWREHELLLGKTFWFYEFPLADSFFVLARVSPLVSFENVDSGRIPLKRIGREYQLTAYILMICAISECDLGK